MRETDKILLIIKQELAAREKQYLAIEAEKSESGIRRFPETLEGHRPAFAVDADRILHSRAYSRYIDKTQVFYLIRNDHITHRVLHVQLVSKIARTIGRVLALNEDLIEAIALGHDIGHPPFGHDGENMLNELCVEHGLDSFQHNIQSVRCLEHIERKGMGVNLTAQTLDGILCHDGEIHERELRPEAGCSFKSLDNKLAVKAANPKEELIPFTLEACVVRFADTVSYVGRDIEDAIELGLLQRDDIPSDCQRILGRTNGTIVHNLVTDLVSNSSHSRISFSDEVSRVLLALKMFNYERIYLNPLVKKNAGLIQNCYRTLFTAYLDDIKSGGANRTAFSEFINKMDISYRQGADPARLVADFIAGMTDDYFLNQAGIFGYDIPSAEQFLGDH
ncbi:MAG: deoxyguanosinetriphosphate triphosphohydrolase family protein [Thermodesulfobacteriota bacterium]